MTSFALVMPVHNRANLIRATLDSALAQEHPAAEIVVVDDGSTDSTPATLESFGDQITVLRQPNAGPAAARNLGLEHVQSEYVAFLDSDDVWFPWTLNVYADIIKTHKQPAFVIGKPLLFSSDAELARVTQEELQCVAYPDHLAAGDSWLWYGVSSFVVRTDRLRAAGGFVDHGAPSGFEDLDLTLRLGVDSGLVCTLQPYTFGYREHPGNIAPRLDGLYGYGAFRHLLSAERGGAYPGGASRGPERQRILAQHARPLSLRCLKAGRIRDGARIFRDTLDWNLKAHRFRYLAAFPPLACANALREVARRARSRLLGHSS